jgi:transcriptional regulator with XRE-family HTH domain
MLLPMPGRESIATLGARRSRQLRQRLADEIARARVASGLSVREVSRIIGVSADRIIRAERGEPGTLTIDLAARIVPVVGLLLAASLHPNGDPVRDPGQLALLSRFQRRISPTAPFRTEVPMPIAGDLRAADATIDLPDAMILIEAETRLTDLQATERRIWLKARDFGADRVVLLVADTPNNRRVLELHPELRERFPVSQRQCLAALARGQDSGGNAIVVL